MTRNSLRLRLFLAIAVAIFPFLAFQYKCTALPVDLGMAGPEHWTVLEVGTGTVLNQSDSSGGSSGGKKHKNQPAASTSQGGVVGNIGIGQNGHFADSGPQLRGDLYLGNNASAQFNGTYTNNRPVGGMVHLGEGATVPSSYSFSSVSDRPQGLLDRARLDARNASAAASALAPTSSLDQISLKKKTLSLDAGVYNLTKFQLKRSTLTLSGAGSFVFNISSTFALKSAQVLLAGGATEANVLFNYTGTNDVTLSGRRGGSVLHGIILALNAKVNLSPGLVVGEIISGNDISLASGATVQNHAPAAVGVPEGTSSTILLSLIGLAALVAFRSFLVHPSNR
jgi:choice-of-anchor A domain-containing protein